MNEQPPGSSPALGTALARVRVLYDEEEAIRQALGLAVGGARRKGATWEQVGHAMRVTKQSAWDRFGHTGRRSPRRQGSPPAGEAELAGALRDRGLDVVQQLRAGPYRIDVACWPVAYEVWNSSTRPHVLIDQTRRIASLINWGWSVCYWKIGEPMVSDALAEFLEDYRRLVLQVQAPPYVLVSEGEVLTEGWVNDGRLELVCWPDAEWRAFVSSAATTRRAGMAKPAESHQG
jgi:hypothetical protein